MKQGQQKQLPPLLSQSEISRSIFHSVILGHDVRTQALVTIIFSSSDLTSFF